MREFDPDTPYLNVKALIDEFESFSCGGDESIDPAARQLRVVPSLAFAVLVMCDRISNVMREALEASSPKVSDTEISHAKTTEGGLRLVSG